MERKNLSIPLVVLCVVLAVLLIVAIIGWTKARNELILIKNGDGQLVEIQDSLAMCDDINTIEKQTACVERLSDLSKIFANYEQKIKSIQTNIQVSSE